MPTAPIIIAEDDAPLRQLISKMLTGQGLAVRPAADGGGGRDYPRPPGDPGK